MRRFAKLTYEELALLANALRERATFYTENDDAEGADACDRLRREIYKEIERRP